MPSTTTRLDRITQDLIDARGPYMMFSPKWPGLIRPKRVQKAVALVRGSIGIFRKLGQDKTPGDLSSDYVAGKIAGKTTGKFVFGPVNKRVSKLYVWASRHSGPGVVIGPKEAKGTEGSRGWITEPGRYPMVIIFHDATRAGPHIDVHIGELSLIYRVKPDLYAQLKFNRDGRLTENSKELLVQHVRDEIVQGARVPQNLDHPDDQSRYEWVGPGTGPEVGEYGAGKSRQIVSESRVDVYKAYQDGPVEFFAPALHPDATLYLYQIYGGQDNRAPILIWGKKLPEVPVFEDRLHLRMVDPADLDKWSDRLDMTTSTAKYDGSSVYLHITQKHTTAWSPRISKRTGRRIEYTQKLDGVAAVTHGEKVQAMGELMFYKTGRGGKKIWLDHPTSGGIINGHDLVPDGITPVIVIYRVDKIGRKTTSDLPFWEQRELAQMIVDKDPEHFMLPELMTPRQARKAGFEGVVIARPGESVKTGIKTKWWTDANDWQIDSVDFKYSEKGNVSGVVWLTSLESGKKFKLGPGQIGDRATCEHMMANPDLYVGSVLKVRSRHGHEGRAAKVLEFHPDKGSAPF